jgi:hypothetical protein
MPPLNLPWGRRLPTLAQQLPLLEAMLGRPLPSRRPRQSKR